MLRPLYANDEVREGILSPEFAPPMQQLFRHAVAEVLLGWVACEIGERQYGDRLALRRWGRRGGDRRGHGPATGPCGARLCAVGWVTYDPNVGDESIAAAGFGHDEAVLAGVFTESPPDDGDILIETVLFDDDIGPDGLHQGALVEQLAAPLHEVEQRLEGLGWQRNGPSVRAGGQQALLDI